MSSISVGDRVSVIGKPQFSGIIKFHGNTQFQTEDIWVGIELESPIGKNDGSVQGVRYFTCQPNYGIFVKENQITKVFKK